MAYINEHKLVEDIQLQLKICLAEHGVRAYKAGKLGGLIDAAGLSRLSPSDLEAITPAIAWFAHYMSWKE